MNRWTPQWISFEDWREYPWCIHGKISTLSGLGVKGNPPRKLVPIRDLGTAPHKEGRQSQR